MTNKEMLENIEYLRERANVTYEEAELLLNQFDGNVMRVLVELEHQGRVYGQAHNDGDTTGSANQDSDPVDDGMKKAKSFFENAMKTHLVIEKNTGDKQTKVADLPAPLAVVGALAAPWLAVAAAGLGFATGYTAKVEKAKDEDEKS